MHTPIYNILAVIYTKGFQTTLINSYHLNSNVMAVVAIFVQFFFHINRIWDMHTNLFATVYKLGCIVLNFHNRSDLMNMVTEISLTWFIYTFIFGSNNICYTYLQYFSYDLYHTMTYAKTLVLLDVWKDMLTITSAIFTHDLQKRLYRIFCWLYMVCVSIFMHLFAMMINWDGS